MSVLKSDDFIADVERQFEWYAVNAGWEVADRYLTAAETTARLLEQHPQLGPRGGFTHPRLRNWRLFVVFRPFKSMSCFTKWLAMMSCCAGQYTATVICQSGCLSHPVVNEQTSPASSSSPTRRRRTARSVSTASGQISCPASASTFRDLQQGSPHP